MNSLYTHLEKNPIVYVTRDIERAMGIRPVQGYYIITNKSPYALEVYRQYPDNVWLIDHEERGFPEALDTVDLLNLPDVAKNITDHKIPVLVFKNTSRIQRLCAEKKWTLLNPSAELAEKVENKITQVEWLGDLTRYLPEHHITKTKDVEWKDTPIILQWAHSHTGEGTIFVESKTQLEILKGTFPDRDARITGFVKGPVFTVNVVVTEKEILQGNISYQITGIPPFTIHRFSTVGNDWALPKIILDAQALSEFSEIVQNVGRKLQQDGWKGLFGIDAVYDTEKKKIFLIEINSRQPASSTYESRLQSIKGGPTLFESHLCALLNISHDPLTLIDNGAQIVLRVSNTHTIDTIRSKADILRRAGYTVVEYKNTKPNSDLLRIQSDAGIMDAEGVFNTRGEIILELLRKV